MVLAVDTRFAGKLMSGLSSSESNAASGNIGCNAAVEQGSPLPGVGSCSLLGGLPHAGVTSMPNLGGLQNTWLPGGAPYGVATVQWSPRAWVYPRVHDAVPGWQAYWTWQPS